MTELLQFGLLWFDDTDHALDIKVRQAAERYAQKYGRQANVCFVNPADISTPFRVAGVEVRSLPTVLRDHLWIGVGIHKQDQEEI